MRIIPFYVEFNSYKQRKNAAYTAFLKGKNKALNILSKASQSEKKIREKLNEDFEEDTIDDVIDFLKKYNFLTLKTF